MQPIGLRCSLFSSLYLASVLSCPAQVPGRELAIRFIDVDIGNAVLIVTPSGESMLMDAGSHLPNNRDRDRVMAAIRKAGIGQLDYVVATHYHNDHYGAIADVAAMFPVVNIVDHGPSVEYHKDLDWWNKWFALFPSTPEKVDRVDKSYETYQAATAKAHHIVVKPGDKLPLRGIDVTVVTSAGNHISKHLPGGGRANAACATTGLRADDPTEDGQSVGLVISFGKFRFINLGDLTWNKSYELFCPNNPIGKVDLYMVTHHGMSDPREVSDIDWGRSCCTPPELQGLSPRVAVESSGPNYHKGSSPMGWQAVRGTSGLEDIWQTNYHVQGGKENNAPDQYIANIAPRLADANAIEVTAKRDGSFKVTNERNGYMKSYPARKEPL